jgi:hypothetical protein
MSPFVDSSLRHQELIVDILDPTCDMAITTTLTLEALKSHTGYNILFIMMHFELDNILL